jgi:predicted DNA-binding mobile mystery protein A
MFNKIKERAREQLDKRFEKRDYVSQLGTPPNGWIKAIRNALGMTAEQMGRRIGMSQQSVTEFEKSEKAGTIKLLTLRKAAEALDCTLVYALVPNKPLSDTVNERARALAIDELERLGHTMLLEKQGGLDLDSELEITYHIVTSISERDIWKIQ